MTFRYALAIADFTRLLNHLHSEREAFERVVKQLDDMLGATASTMSASVKPPDYEVAQQDLKKARLYSECLEEYKFLRTEIEAIWGQTYTTMNFMLATIGLIITAAYGTNGEPLILLPMASVLTLGAHSLIRIHTTRVWRIVGYMRRTLEVNLTGIRWETRLAARCVASGREAGFDRDIFDGHIRILDAVNFALVLGIVFARSTHDIENNMFRHDGVASWSVVAACLLLPLAILFWSIFTRARLRRGAGLEADHLVSWERYLNGIRACHTEPPPEFRDQPTTIGEAET